AAALATADTATQAEALPVLRQALGAASADERTAAALALAAMRPTLDASDRDVIARLLADPGDSVRAAAARAVGALSATAFHSGAPVGLGALLSDEAWNVRAAAADALGCYGARVSAEDRGALRAALADPDETTRQAAALALAQVDPDGARTLIGELLQAVKTRRAIGALTPLAQRRELEIYAAMERPSWTVVARVSAWLSAETHWATQLGACALIERWRYAPMAARSRLLWLSERASSPAVRAAARMGLRAALAESPDLEPAPPDGISDLRDLPESGPQNEASHTPRALSALKLRAAPDLATPGLAATTLASPAGDLALRLDANEGKTA
ncbi:MAG TPA: HEAT repeat domain-containing protein, partial [Ktedonobacterales bacterium]|nr:HEAT repeat domain-containing protein [Ktedonobacterales bacterium]